ncbi:MAG: phosphatase PAP2 family protein [Candidatus Moranbacteria bacterium]|nr:phosphatase PAP2 family protein [Candidatus Moranbacteria bacterium]
MATFGFFRNISKNIARVFSGWNLVWILAAFVLTGILVFSGFDWRYFELTRNAILQNILWPAVLLGGFVPMFGILPFWLLSSWAKKRKLEIVAFAVGQAVVLGWLVSSFFKFFTGRPEPPGIIAGGLISDTSHIFRFGLGRGGIFFGWPSSHTAVAFSMALALITLRPKDKFLKYIALAYAFYIGIGVSATIHWFSDFLAGAIAGAVIGAVVGKSFRSGKLKT